MLENKKVIIFDLDGTLIDSIGVWNDIDRALIESVGTIPVDDIDIGKQRDEKLAEYSKSNDIYLEYCGFLGEKYQSKLPKEEIKKIRYDIAAEFLEKKVNYKPNVEDTLKYLKEKGYILVIASTTNDFTIDVYKHKNQNIISKANLEDYFTLIFSKGAVKEFKPNPEVHLRIMKELNVTPDECLIIEDSLIGVQAANNAGIDVAVMYDKFSDGNREKINELSKYQFNNFKELLDTIKAELD